MIDPRSPAQPGGAAEIQTGVAGRLRGWWHALRERQKLCDEFASLSRYGQLDGVLQEAGTSRGALGAILHASRRLAAMLRRLGISRERLRATGTVHDVELTCTMCEVTGKCQHWLATGKTAGYEEFCPNAATFDSLRVRQQKS